MIRTIDDLRVCRACGDYDYAPYDLSKPVHADGIGACRADALRRNEEGQLESVPCDCKGFVE